MKLVNTYKKIRDDYFSWVISIAGEKKELENIKNVTYYLHKTFPNQMMVSSNSSNNFSRETAGWGEFLIKADVKLKNGDVKHGKLWLDLGFRHTKDRKEKFKGEIK
jgi:transcription initiation factor IIF auxiliary subunit